MRISQSLESGGRKYVALDRLVGAHVSRTGGTVDNGQLTKRHSGRERRQPFEAPVGKGDHHAHFATHKQVDLLCGVSFSYDVLASVEAPVFEEPLDMCKRLPIETSAKLVLRERHRSRRGPTVAASGEQTILTPLHGCI